MTEELADGSGYARGGHVTGGRGFTLPSVGAEHVSVSSIHRPLGAGTGPAHAPTSWEESRVLETARPLCEVAGGLDPIPWPWFAIVPAGVRCPDCLEWMHA
jgi:hypothetical protein